MSSIVVAGDTSGSITISAPAVSGSNTLTLPLATDTLVGKATTDTLTNKTLTSPTLTSPALGTVASGNISACTATSLAVSGFVGTAATGALTLPVGTTAQRPTGVTGMTRLNSSANIPEYYNGTGWILLSTSYSVDYLVVAGAGGGGGDLGGGGGAGGYIAASGIVAGGGSY